MGKVKDYIKKTKKDSEDKQRRKKKRIKLVGEDAVAHQDSRNFNKKAKAAITKGDSIDKATTREAIKRVGEYKKGEFTEMAAGGKTKGKHENCRGMGCATQGGRYKQTN